MNCCYWCLTLLGVMYFSVAITEEKEEETLPLLRMTGIRNMTLLIGKSIPRLAVVVLLILIAAPFLMLAVTLGGGYATDPADVARRHALALSASWQAWQESGSARARDAAA